MRTSFSFNSDESSSASYVFGIDSSGFSQIIIDGKWTYKDFRSNSPSYYLAMMQEVSTICLTTSNEKDSLFYIDVYKDSVSKKYSGQIGAFIKTTESNLIFLSNALRENSILEIYFEIEVSKARDSELIATLESYKGKKKAIKFEELIVEYYIKSTAFRNISSEAST